MESHLICGKSSLNWGRSTSRAAASTRRMLEFEGIRSPLCSRCHAMVSGPASSPSSLKEQRRSMMTCRKESSIWRGLVSGPEEGASTASSPPSRYRVTRVCTHCQETPYRRATCAFDKSWWTTERMMTRDLDILHRHMQTTINEDSTQVSTRS